ncbi:hypothetical protein MNBD_GAMMA07-2801, partial [hydrothermal vent metagenome]
MSIKKRSIKDSMSKFKLSQINKTHKTTLLVITAVVSSGLYHAPIQAAGFQLVENSASGQGNAFAGAAAIAKDAS